MTVKKIVLDEIAVKEIQQLLGDTPMRYAAPILREINASAQRNSEGKKETKADKKTIDAE